MIGARVDYLLGFLGTDNSRLSMYAGCSESNFSRLRSGSRKLTPHSSTVRRFAEAVYSCAQDSDLTVQLCELIGCDETDKDEIVGRLVEWLFLGEDISGLPKNARNDPAAFGSKLDSVMLLTDMTNSRLARQTNIDASYISRMRSGKRMPKNNPELIGRICSVLTVRAAEMGKEDELADMMGLQRSDGKEWLSEKLAAWLTDRTGAGSLSAVKRLISSISIAEHIPDYLLIDPAVAADPKILDESNEYYVGLPGIQRGAVRLLGNAVRHGSEALMLYSDLSQKWLVHDFFPTWLTLMHECLKKGIRIWVIHHLDREIDEMEEAIRCWLPLYMSGLIEPYYCTLPQGKRFSITIFSDPGRACLAGQCVTGNEDEAIFRYATNPKEIIAVEQEMCTLLSLSRPLIRHSWGISYPVGEYQVFEQNGIRLCIGDSCVHVCKLSEPKMTLSSEHPKMIEGFKAYAEKLK